MSSIARRSIWEASTRAIGEWGKMGKIVGHAAAEIAWIFNSTPVTISHKS